MQILLDVVHVFNEVSSLAQKKAVHKSNSERNRGIYCFISSSQVLFSVLYNCYKDLLPQLLRPPLCNFPFSHPYTYSLLQLPLRLYVLVVIFVAWGCVPHWPQIIQAQCFCFTLRFISISI